MYRGERVAVVVPAYNEGPHVRAVLETLPTVVDRAYVVDDASEDETWSEIRAAVRAAPAGRTLAGTPSGDAGTPAGDARTPSGDARTPSGDARTPAGDGSSVTDGGHQREDVEDGRGRAGAEDGRGRASDRGLPGTLPVSIPDEDEPPVVVAVRHGENRGRGAAVETGYRLALDDGMDVVAVMDGDGQMDPDQLHRVLHPVATGRADYAKGNRLDGPRYWQGMSAWRLFGNVLLTGLTRVSTGYWGLRDPQNGYTAISRDALESLDLAALYDDYGFLNDVLGALSIQGARVTDVPLPAVYGDEDSGIRYGQFVPAVSTLLLVNFLRRLYVDGTRRRRVSLPAAYAVAAVVWLGALLVGVASALPGVESVPLALATVGGLAAAPALAATGGLATALAVGLDRHCNAVLEAGDPTVVDTRGEP